MTDILHELGSLVAQYAEIFKTHGFECQEGLRFMTSEDLEAMSIPLDHASFLLRHKDLVTSQLFSGDHAAVMPSVWPDAAEHDLQLLDANGGISRPWSMCDLLRIGVSRGHARTFLNYTHTDQAFRPLPTQPSVLAPLPPPAAQTQRNWTLHPQSDRGIVKPHGTIPPGQPWKFLIYDLEAVKKEVDLEFVTCTCLEGGRVDQKIQEGTRFSGHFKRCGWKQMIVEDFGDRFFTRTELVILQKESRFTNYKFSGETLLNFLEEDLLNRGKRCGIILGRSFPWLVCHLVNNQEMYRLHPFIYQFAPQLHLRTKQK